jgi:hypothetical protein
LVVVSGCATPTEILFLTKQSLCLFVFVDQCHQMRVAIESEFPDTRHRWCKWHVLRKAKESLGPVYSKNSSFKRELHELLDQTVCVEEFEKKWADVIARYSCGDPTYHCMCSMQVVDITPIKHRLTSITSIRVVQQKHRRSTVCL